MRKTKEVIEMTDDTNVTPEDPTPAPAYAAPYPTTLAAEASAPKHHRWPIWVAAVAVAVVLFAAGAFTGVGFASRFGARGFRQGFAVAAVRYGRAGARGFAPAFRR
jgi:hypothetical protein